MRYDFDYFSGRDIVYPTKPSTPRMGSTPTASEARAYADALDAHEAALLDYKKKFEAASAMAGERLREFETALKSDYTLSDAEFSLLWSEAYDRKHSGGFSEVYYEFDSLYEFVMKYKEATKG